MNEHVCKCVCVWLNWHRRRWRLSLQKYCSAKMYLNSLSSLPEWLLAGWLAVWCCPHYLPLLLLLAVYPSSHVRRCCTHQYVCMCTYFFFISSLHTFFAVAAMAAGKLALAALSSAAFAESCISVSAFCLDQKLKCMCVCVWRVCWRSHVCAECRSQHAALYSFANPYAHIQLNILANCFCCCFSTSVRVL